MSKKSILGQFFTRNHLWRDKLVNGFIAGHSRVIDPFAGEGDLLESFTNVAGYDVDPTMGWPVNDSLVSIPKGRVDEVCITNPPFLAKNSATKRGFRDASKYFASYPRYGDLYQVAIHHCLESFDRVVAIIPESFLSTDLFKDRLVFVNIIEGQMFEDTECPVLVAAWSPAKSDDFTVYKNGHVVGMWSDIARRTPLVCPIDTPMKFNAPTGQIGLICVDGSTGSRISFTAGEEIDGVSEASRYRTRIAIERPSNALIEEANFVLKDLRESSQDTVLSPFKGNARGTRRRRLDYATARKILGQADWNLTAPNIDLAESWVNRYEVSQRARLYGKALLAAYHAEFKKP